MPSTVLLTITMFFLGVLTVKDARFGARFGAVIVWMFGRILVLGLNCRTWLLIVVSCCVVLMVKVRLVLLTVVGAVGLA